MLFISSSEEGDLARNLAALGQAPVLTVSDIADFTSRGGMIQFVVIDNRVRFTINVGNWQRAGPVMSSELLKVALSILHGRSSKE